MRLMFASVVEHRSPAAATDRVGFGKPTSHAEPHGSRRATPRIRDRFARPKATYEGNL